MRKIIPDYCNTFSPFFFLESSLFIITSKGFASLSACLYFAMIAKVWLAFFSEILITSFLCECSIQIEQNVFRQF